MAYTLVDNLLLHAWYSEYFESLKCAVNDKINKFFDTFFHKEYSMKIFFCSAQTEMELISEKNVVNYLKKYYFIEHKN